MIRPLRKFHLISWSILAVLLPVLGVLSIVFRPPNSPAELAPGSITITVREEFQDDGERRDSTSVIGIDVTTSLRSSACLVYAIQNNKRLLLGSIYEQQMNSFRIAGNVDKVMLIDNLQGRILHEHIVTHK